MRTFMWAASCRTSRSCLRLGILKDSQLNWISRLTHSALQQWFLNLSLHKKRLDGLLMHRLLGPLPEFLIPSVWGGAWKFAFLTSPNVSLSFWWEKNNCNNYCFRTMNFKALKILFSPTPHSTSVSQSLPFVKALDVLSSIMYHMLTHRGYLKRQNLLSYFEV